MSLENPNEAQEIVPRSKRAGEILFIPFKNGELCLGDPIDIQLPERARVLEVVEVKKEDGVLKIHISWGPYNRGDSLTQHTFYVFKENDIVPTEDLYQQCFSFEHMSETYEVYHKPPPTIPLEVLRERVVMGPAPEVEMMTQT